MTRTYECGCGSDAETYSIFFEYENDILMKVKVWICEECLWDEGLWCEDHGACSITNYPPLQSALPEEDKTEGEDLVFCPGCVEDILKSVDDCIINEYLQLISARCDGEVLKCFDRLTKTFLPGRIFQKQPTMSACCLISHVSFCSIDLAVLCLVDEPLSPLREPIPPLDVQELSLYEKV